MKTTDSHTEKHQDIYFDIEIGSLYVLKPDIKEKILLKEYKSDKIGTEVFLEAQLLYGTELKGLSTNNCIATTALILSKSVKFKRVKATSVEHLSEWTDETYFGNDFPKELCSHKDTRYVYYTLDVLSGYMNYSNGKQSSIKNTKIPVNVFIDLYVKQQYMIDFERVK